MKTKDLREKSLPELQDLLRDTSRELIDLRIRKETGQLEKPHMIKSLRKEIARLETLLDEKSDPLLQDGDAKGGATLSAIAGRSGTSHRKVLRAIANAS